MKRVGKYLRYCNTLQTTTASLLVWFVYLMLTEEVISTAHREMSQTAAENLQLLYNGWLTISTEQELQYPYPHNIFCGHFSIIKLFNSSSIMCRHGMWEWVLMFAKVSWVIESFLTGDQKDLSNTCFKWAGLSSLLPSQANEKPCGLCLTHGQLQTGWPRTGGKRICPPGYGR